ncbi:MAG: translesion DNA synthesis-associated protein ImuA [Gammaproteobacteria bacterium]
MLLLANRLGGGSFGPDHGYISTGFDELDVLLPGQGWPKGRLVEILSEAYASGAALYVLMSALAKLSRSRLCLAWVSPPYIPYAPTLVAMGVDLSKMLVIRASSEEDKLWALEQSLRSSACGAVLGWLDAARSNTLRRLQLAAEVGGGMGVLFRSLQAATQPSPAVVRLRVEPRRDSLLLYLIKRVGGYPTGPIHLKVEGMVLKHTTKQRQVRYRS